jgi:hypothetical protein
LPLHTSYPIMRIPFAKQAVIPIEKLVDYLLDVHHPDGGPKARVFAHAGFSAEAPEEFEQALRDQHLTQEARLGKLSPFGTKFENTGRLTGPDGEVFVTSVWIIRHGETAPRLITVVPEHET